MEGGKCAFAAVQHELWEVGKADPRWLELWRVLFGGKFLRERAFAAVQREPSTMLALWRRDIAFPKEWMRLG